MVRCVLEERTEQAQLEAPSSFAQRLAEAGMRRLSLHESLDLAKGLFDVLSATRERTVALQNNASVLHALCIRKLFLDSLERQIVDRLVLPMTLNTLANLIAEAYLRYAN